MTQIQIGKKRIKKNKKEKKKKVIRLIFSSDDESDNVADGENKDGKLEDSADCHEVLQGASERGTGQVN